MAHHPELTFGDLLDRSLNTAAILVLHRIKTGRKKWPDDFDLAEIKQMMDYCSSLENKPQK